MGNENLELEAKPAGNKELWLFLIVLDIIFLCVCGFFLYKNVGQEWLAAASGSKEVVFADENLPDEPEVIEIEEMASLPVQQVSTPEIISPETLTPAVSEPVATSVPAPAAVPAPAEETVIASAMAEIEAAPAQLQTAAAPVEKPRESVKVEKNAKSKYRRVTFRWFGEGNKVEIVSGFTMSKPQALKKKGDYWETTLSIAPGTYKFLYIIDGENRRDPYSAEKDGRSVIEIK